MMLDSFDISYQRFNARTPVPAAFLCDAAVQNDVPRCVLLARLLGAGPVRMWACCRGIITMYSLSLCPRCCLSDI